MLIALLVAFLTSLGGDGIQTLFSGFDADELEALGIAPEAREVVLSASEDLSARLVETRGAWTELREDFSQVLRNHDADRDDFADSADRIDELLLDRYRSAIDARAKMKQALDAEQWEAVFAQR